MSEGNPNRYIMIRVDLGQGPRELNYDLSAPSLTEATIAQCFENAKGAALAHFRGPPPPPPAQEVPEETRRLMEKMAEDDAEWYRNISNPDWRPWWRRHPVSP